jgi:hypothetical protein
LEKIRKHIDQVRQSMRRAGLDTVLVKEFLESQLEVVKHVNLFRKDSPSKKDYLSNEIKLTEIHLLKDMLDTGHSYEHMKEVDEIVHSIVEKEMSIKQALAEVGIESSTVYEFLESQIEVLKDVNQLNKEDLTKWEYAQHILWIAEASKLRDLLH